MAERHRAKTEIWLVFYKKASGRPSLPYDGAVEEAICYGWIDGVIKPVDGEKFTRRFSRRRRGSRWSEHNRRRALKMLQAGKMTPAGKALLPPDVLDEFEGEG
ncbi:MAG: hypothetical protein GTN49_06515 [candidate division Zixibacteria bacterium]|nr:hypothetical protein [candidate division Zixibacteria bacterium]